MSFEGELGNCLANDVTAGVLLAGFCLRLSLSFFPGGAGASGFRLFGGFDQGSHLPSLDLSVGRI